MSAIKQVANAVRAVAAYKQSGGVRTGLDNEHGCKRAAKAWHAVPTAMCLLTPYSIRAAALHEHANVQVSAHMHARVLWSTSLSGYMCLAPIPG